MTDENKNIENNQEENKNKPEVNKIWWKKMLALNQTCGLKPKFKVNIYRVLIVALIFYLVIFLFAKNIKIDDTENIKTEKIATNNELKEKGLHYIGKMKVPREGHSVVTIGEDKLLIVGGISKNGVKHISLGLITSLQNVPDIEEHNAEIFNLKTRKSKVIAKNFDDYLYSVNYFDGDNIMFVPQNKNDLMIFNIKKNKIKTYDNFFLGSNLSYSKQALVFADNIVVCEGYSSLADGPSCILYNKYLNNILQINKDIIDTEQFNTLKLVKLNEDKFIIYRYLYNKLGSSSKLYIYKYSIKSKTYSNIIKHENVGNLISITPITEDLILISSCLENRVRQEVENFKLELFDIKKDKIIKNYNVDELVKFVPIANNDGKEKKYNVSQYIPLNKDELISSDLKYKFNLNDYSLNKTNIELPVIRAQITVIENNKIIITGGIYKGTNNIVSDRIYLYNF